MLCRRVRFGGGSDTSLFLAYGGDRDPEEHCGEDYNSVDPPPLGILVVLDVTCGNKES
jgi:hypothetical protein